MIRFMSFNYNNNSQHSYTLPPLMIIKPKDIGLPIMTPLKIHLYLKPFIDNNFDLKNFLIGAKQALTVISGHLSDGNIETIKSLVTCEAYNEISMNYSQYTNQQKQLLRVTVDDIQHCFLYSLWINKLSKNEFNVKMLTIFDVLINGRQTEDNVRHELQHKNLQFFDFHQNYKLLEQLLDKKFFCIYEFSRHYTTDSNSDWIVSKLVHYRNKDLIKLYIH
ncbi:uncharacterized protein LOC128953999 [Oppia nitens]|uniref:uncharacterized protein LOC128953999 n=1 Tax=Oppia nitens TaxID=1686743 RepID=UPI0023DA2EC8|nr:uncharacterized protein LOC128953999 [Oppia nitens]